MRMQPWRAESHLEGSQGVWAEREDRADLNGARQKPDDDATSRLRRQRSSCCMTNRPAGEKNEQLCGVAKCRFVQREIAVCVARHMIDEDHDEGNSSPEVD